MAIDNWQQFEDVAKALGIRLFMDGTAWCATPPWFQNLAEHPAGFGDDQLEAVCDLFRQFKPVTKPTEEK